MKLPTSTLVLLTFVVLFVVTLMLSPKPDHSTVLQQELDRLRSENVRIHLELSAATESLQVEKITAEQALHELEIARKNVRVVTREVFRPDGTLSERLVDARHSEERETSRQVESRASTQSVQTQIVIHASTASAMAEVTESIHLTQRNDSRTGFGVGPFVSPKGPGLVVSYHVGSLGPASLDVLVGGRTLFAPALGLGASVEILPRLGLGAAAMAEPLALSVYPVVLLKHEF